MSTQAPFLKAVAPVEEEDVKLSPVMQGVKNAYNRHKENGDRFLLVFLPYGDDGLRYIGVAPHEYYKDIHDKHLGGRDMYDAQRMIMALDLRKPFFVQIPEELQTMKTLNHFRWPHITPINWIQDSTDGTSPSERRKNFVRTATHGDGPKGADEI